MMSFMFAFIVVLGLWRLQAHLHKAKIDKKHSNDLCIDTGNDSRIFLSQTELVFLTTFMGDEREILRFSLNKILTFSYGNEQHNSERKATASVLVSWSLLDGNTKVFSFDFSGPNATEQSQKLYEGLRSGTSKKSKSDTHTVTP